MKAMPFKSRRLTILCGLLLLMALAVPTLVFAAPPSPLSPASESAKRISDLFTIVASVAAIIFVLVEGLLVFAVVRFRRRDGDEMPRQIHGNKALELLWTIIPAGIMVSLFVITVPVLDFERSTPQAPMTVEVTGRQWQWEFKYPDTGVTATKELRIPSGKPIFLELKSLDVIHSFWVPQLAGKTDVIPGYNNTMWFQADQPGEYDGQCAEFCGLEHYAMLVKVIAMTPADFQAWMDEQVKEASTFTPVGTDINTALPVGDATKGADLYKAMGCSSCHSLDGSALVGPSFQGLASRAATRKPGYSAELYIHESIVQPCTFVVDSFTCVMPQDFGTSKLSKQNLADIIAFLLQQ
jgi:cytochrome c oxidase subunit II